VTVFGALIVGDEILSGRRADAHLSRVVSALSQRGLALSWARYVGDEPPRIVAALQDALAAGDTVFVFGGIGATPDDHTRQCAAQALGVPLALHPEAAVLITERGREMAAQRGEVYDESSEDHRRRLHMGTFPAGATIIPNPYNRIPGFSVGELHFMPGFPVMAHPMLDWLLDTRYAGGSGAAREHVRAVRVLGANESRLIPTFERVERDFPGVRIFSLPSVDHPQFGPHIEIGVKGVDEAAVERAMASLVAGAREAGAIENGASGAQ
jgi:molybdopterin-biosynthesis enzyme MoeA-like protein